MGKNAFDHEPWGSTLTQADRDLIEKALAATGYFHLVGSDGRIAAEFHAAKQSPRLRRLAAERVEQGMNGELHLPDLTTRQLRAGMTYLKHRKAHVLDGVNVLMWRSVLVGADCPGWDAEYGASAGPDDLCDLMAAARGLELASLAASLRPRWADLTSDTEGER